MQSLQVRSTHPSRWGSIFKRVVRPALSIRRSLTDKSRKPVCAHAIAGAAHISSWETHMRSTCIIAQLSYLRRATKRSAGRVPFTSAGPDGATIPSWYGRQLTTLRTNFLRRAPLCSTGAVP